MSSCRQLYHIVIFSLTIVLSGCGTKDEIKAPAVTADSVKVAKVRPDQQLRNAHIILYNKALKTTDVQADYVEKYEKYDSTLAWILKVLFFDSTGREVSNLVADSGLVREKTNTMVANGHVVVITEDSARLETEQLSWNARDNKIESDSFVTIYQRGDTLTGYGLEADQRLTRIKIKKQVTGSIKNTGRITP
ncbi:MAG: LPS export ABC transporter periplasmic protein LptC [candidate division Zixibacteria bacterium]|nr:LPS export ABC transporter periplasmic protein LptC [candidate division Zixibacteria bacterium]